MRIHDLGICLLHGNSPAFLNEFTEASIVSAPMQAGPNNLHYTKGVNTASIAV